MGGGIGLGGVVDNRLGEHERAVLGLFFALGGVIGGGEVDAGAALEGGEEGRGDAGAHPAGDSVELLAGYEAAGGRRRVVLHGRRDDKDRIFILFFFPAFVFFPTRSTWRTKEGKDDETRRRRRGVFWEI